eukprot:10391781-Lingulodinium_polyedra.AAC.1
MPAPLAQHAPRPGIVANEAPLGLRRAKQLEGGRNKRTGGSRTPWRPRQGNQQTRTRAHARLNNPRHNNINNHKQTQQNRQLRVSRP